MDKASRKELIEIIESQKEQIKRYAKNLNSLVEAFKGAQKEKEALESSLKALMVNQIAVAQNDGSITNAETSSDSKEQSFQDPLNVSKSYIDVGVQQLQEQVQKLTAALTTLTEEKSRIEASYQADKKKSNQEQEETIKQFVERQANAEADRKCLEVKIQELNMRLCMLQQDREAEQTNQALMLKEMQKLLTEERFTREQVEHELEEVRAVIKARDNMPDKSEEYQRKIRDLSNDVTVLQNRLKAAEDKAKQPSSFVLKLQEEMAEMKAQHRIAVQQEQKRASEAEDQRRIIAERGEERVASLESKLSELSKMVGTYDRLRQQDQMAIQKLKDRIIQLDLENTALVRVVNNPQDSRESSVKSNHSEEDESNLDVQALMDKIIKLKGFLKLANQRSSKPMNLQGFLESSLENCKDDDDDLHSKCHQEVKQLKDEFEHYKLRAQAVLKNRHAKDSDYNKELEMLKSQIMDVKDKMKTVRFEYLEKENNYLKQIESLEHNVNELKDSNKKTCALLELEHRHQILELGQQLQKQRIRTIALLEEKDKELASLKAGIVAQRSTPDRRRDNQDLSPVLSGENESYKSEEALVNELKANSHIQTEGQVLHYTQELSRKDVEIASLRKTKHQIEASLRELEQTAYNKELKFLEQIEILKEEICKLERNQSRENANLEYLKNVTLNFILCSDSLDKKHMLNAIATILQFSPKEIELIQTHKAHWGWSKR